mmetsp:Transcript_4376/g.7784  ORF Transcript_4376/g.7784 Transcript_4376/m.7784 type:complete len:81 (-) Transcript_4376:328-570(-)
MRSKKMSLQSFWLCIAFLFVPKNIIKPLFNNNNSLSFSHAYAMIHTSIYKLGRPHSSITMETLPILLVFYYILTSPRSAF